MLARKIKEILKRECEIGKIATIENFNSINFKHIEATTVILMSIYPDNPKITTFKFFLCCCRMQIHKVIHKKHNNVYNTFFLNRNSSIIRKIKSMFCTQFPDFSLFSMYISLVHCFSAFWLVFNFQNVWLLFKQIIHNKYYK